jgi:60 kDa SS-A/Ro ribonucleoprotein
MGAGLTSAPSLSCAKAAAAMALTIARTEENHVIYGFATSIKDMGITAKDSLTSAMTKTARHNFGSTDCAQAMLYAQKHKLELDAFVTITDSETYAGSIAPAQALRDYRNWRGVQDVRNIVIGMTATKFTIADPKDPYSLDIVGFDANVPLLVTDCIRGASAGIASEAEE